MGLGCALILGSIFPFLSPNLDLTLTLILIVNALGPERPSAACACNGERDTSEFRVRSDDWELVELFKGKSYNEVESMPLFPLKLRWIRHNFEQHLLPPEALTSTPTPTPTPNPQTPTPNPQPPTLTLILIGGGCRSHADRSLSVGPPTGCSQPLLRHGAKRILPRF